MSANEPATTARKPKSASAHGACSRELPQPKFRPATRTDAPHASGWFRMKPGVGAPACVVPPAVEQVDAEAGRGWWS